jgi:transcriptional regulator GlxA family with amidase domain
MPPIRIAVLGYDHVQTLDIAGPLDAFVAATSQHSGAYTTVTTTLTGTQFTSEAGLRIKPDCPLADALPLDTLIIPGGAG